MWTGSRCQWHRRNTVFSVAGPGSSPSQFYHFIVKVSEPFRQLPNGDNNRTAPTTSSRTEQGLTCRAKLHLRLLAHGLEHGDRVRQRPAFQQSALPGSEAASARLGTPRCDALGPASRRARKGNGAPAAWPELAALAPKRPLPPPPQPPQPQTQASPWQPLCLGDAGSVFQASRPRLKGGRQVKGRREIPRARARRHAGHARSLDPEGRSVSGYARDLGEVGGGSCLALRSSPALGSGGHLARVMGGPRTSGTSSLSRCARSHRIHGSEVGQFLPLILPKYVVLKDNQ